MDIHAEMIPNQRIAYVRQVGPYGPGNIQAMETLKKWAGDNHLLHDSAILFGIPQDNPETTPPENCRYDACIVISNEAPVHDPICEGELAGGLYVIGKVKHTAEDIQKAWADIFPALQASGYQLDNKPIMERYTGYMLSIDYCELCIPVK